MNYTILTRMFHSGSSGTRRAVGSSGTRAVSPASPQTLILRIGTHRSRHNRWLDRRLKNVHEGDTVVLEYGGNYCEFDWAAIAAHPDVDHLPAVNFGQFREFYHSAIGKCLAKGARVVLLTLPTLLPQRYFDFVSRNLDRDNILHWLGNDACSLSHWNEQYNEEILSLAAQYQLPVIDINPTFLRHHYLEDCYAINGMHPNNIGHSFIAELVAEWERNNR